MRTTCGFQMVDSFLQTTFKVELLRLNIFNSMEASGFANPHLAVLSDSIDRKSPGLSIQPYELQLELFKIGRTHGSRLEDLLHRPLCDAETEEVVAGLPNEVLFRHLSCSIVQLQISSGVLFLKAILEQFAFDFGGAAIVFDRSGGHDPNQVPYSHYDRDLLFERIFQGQRQSDGAIFSELIKLEPERLFGFPRRGLQKLREIRNQIAHEEQRISFDFEHASRQVSEYRSHIEEVDRAIRLLGQSLLVRNAPSQP